MHGRCTSRTPRFGEDYLIKLDAESVLELQVSAPSWVDERSGACSANMVHFDSPTGVLQFHTNCAMSRNTYIQTVMYKDWVLVVTDEMREPNIPWETVLSSTPEIVNMDVQVHCNCPAFLWWGSWNQLEQRDSALFPEGTPYPYTRDPDGNNIICKHLAAVFRQHF